jgi:hypothetical protein
MQPKINPVLFMIALDKRREKVFYEINQPTFARLKPPLPKICRFIPYSKLKKKVEQIGNRMRYMKPEFISEIEESCEPEYAAGRRSLRRHYSAAILSLPQISGLQRPGPTCRQPAAGPPSGLERAAIPQQGPDHALPLRPRISADDCPLLPGRCPHACKRTRGWANGHPRRDPGFVPITDSRPRFHPLAQNPDPWLQCS